jgi:glycosyltransferase involved in cell wall biosynthesis
MNMRILIFGEAFLPPAYMPRLRYFISYLTANGWDVELIIEKSNNEDNIPTNIPVHCIDYYTKTTSCFVKLEWLIKFFINLLYDYKGNFFFKKSSSFLKNKHYDIVFCTSSFTFPLTTAAKIAQRMDIPLIVDLRDIVEQSPDDNHFLQHNPPKLIGKFIVELFKKINLRRRNNVLKVAHAITTVSPWHVKTLSKYNRNVTLIYNGFDEKLFVPEIIRTDIFTISYFGRIYNEEMRNPRLLFNAIQNLSQKGLISSQNFRTQWFVDEQSKNTISEILNEYSISEYVEFENFIKHSELIHAMNKSSILVTLSNATHKKNYFGIMTTKIFESIGANRPILCVPKNNDDLSSLIEKEKLGCTSSTVLEVEEYIYNQFLFWKKNGCTVGTIDETTRMSFSRRKGAEILEHLFISTINETR